MSKLITVFGATGAQGGAVVNGLLAKGGYTVRGVTRNVDGEKAQALKSKGVEMVKASLDDQASVELALKDSYGVFLVTNYWEFMDKEREIKQGKMVADVCKKLGVSHLVYSGLELVKDITGKDCPHFDGKGEVEKYLDAINQPNTSVRMPFYYSNFVSFTQKLEDGSRVFASNMEGPMDAIDIEEAGPAVVAVFSQPEEFIGKKIGLSGDRLTMEEYCAILSKATGVTFNHNKLPLEEYAKLFPGSDDMANMFHYYYTGKPDRNIELTKRLNPKVKTFTEWAKESKHLFT